MDMAKRLLLPGFVFQSVVIAGGYGTGRELVEFFLSRGPSGGLMAMAVATGIWSAVAMVTFEFARVFQAYDYRSFFRHLLGRGWWVFEICYLALTLIILAVVAAAAGAILQETFGLPYLAGVLGITVLVGTLVFGGSDAIEVVFTAWSGVLYVVYAVFFAWCLARFGPEIRGALASGTVEGSWIRGGVEYAAYNLGVIPAVLFVVRHHKNRGESLVSGFLAGPLAMAPALLFFLAVAGEYPTVLNEAVPANHMLEVLGSRWFQILFQVMLFGTLVETGTGLIHALNERLAQVRSEHVLSGRHRAIVAVGFLSLGAITAQLGLIVLIAEGYGTLTWLFLAVYVVPVLTWGTFRVWRAERTGLRQGSQ